MIAEIRAARDSVSKKKTSARPRWPTTPVSSSTPLRTSGAALPAVCPPAPSPTAASPPAAPPPPAGDPPPGSDVAAPGGVIVRSAPTGADLFAPIEVRCRDEERLVGGGCGGGCALVENSEPIAYGRTDSVAAGWRCKCSRAESGGAPPVGFALCQALRAAP